MTEKEKAQQGYLYNANYDAEILQNIDECMDLCHRFNQLMPSDYESQNELLKKILYSMGERTVIRAPFWCDYSFNVTVGNYFYANHNFQLVGIGKITIGDYVFFAPNCVVTTAEHAIDPEQRKEGLEVALPITIGNNVWIGAGTTILGGVTIGDNTVIGAGSVVTKDIPSGVVAFGTPCKVIRKITAEDKNRYPIFNCDEK